MWEQYWKDRGAPWEYDPGPAQNRSWSRLFAETPTIAASESRCLYVDGRPHQTHDVVDRLQVLLEHPQEVIRVEGYQGENLKQVRTIRLE